MVTGKNKLESIEESRFSGISRNMRIVVLMLLSVVISLPSLSHADGLFDFQMKLAEKGNAEAEFKVGEMYETGFGVKQDMKQAEIWITKAAEKGHETANFKLLYWDLEKNGVTKSNKAAFESLQAKAKEGNPQAEYYVGKMYSRGVGVKKDPDQAITWLNKAAFVGVLEAEREMVVAREDKQRLIQEQKRAEEKRRAQQRAQQDRERQARLEEQRKLQQQKELEAKARADEMAKKQKLSQSQSKAEAEARMKAEKEAAEKQQLLAKQKAEEQQREAQKQALIKKREAEEAQRKAQFESDPCSGKSARFLSTCK
jgi:flagellar biosynthesis GTPase FlhF